MENKKEKIPVKIISDEIGDKEEMHKFSFNRKAKREMNSIERKQPAIDRKFKIKLNLQEGKQAHQKAIRNRQEKTHLKCIVNK